MNQQIYMITGVRGSGKTVMLTDISKHFRKDKDWIVIELNQIVTCCIVLLQSYTIKKSEGFVYKSKAGFISIRDWSVY